MHLEKLLNDDWYFIKKEICPDSFCTDNWEKISLPHTYNNIDGQDGGDDYYRGPATYVKKFRKAEVSEKTFLEFRGVGQSCEVWLNGSCLGRHQGGYSTFRFDISDCLKEDNVLFVKTDNGVSDSVYPQTADFTFYGGIYRDVRLIEVSAEHFDLSDHGSNGLTVTPRRINEKAEVEVEVWTSGGDTVGISVGDFKTEIPLENNHGKTVFEIEEVHLWDGLNDPYLYTLEARLLKNGSVKDSLNVRFGVRDFRIDPEKGFFLNGRSYPLRGVSKHQDRLGKGNAVSREDLEEDMRIIRELGATTIRLAHYQHDQYFYDLCDENGLVVWAEIPYISRHMPEGKENTLSQMEELVKQNYNHPSIVCWGLSNEITIGGGAESESLLDNHRELNDLVHRLDPTRPTTMAHVMTQDPNGTIVGLSDIASYNHYYGWYVGDTGEYAKFFDRFHSEHPDYCMGLSEYGADASPKLHSAKPHKGDYSEEYQCKYHEEVLQFINERPYLWATHVWNMFDFAADARREGGNPGKNQKGLVTMDRKLKKDSFYLYKSFWNQKEEFVHICGRRYVNRDEDVTKVKVYSNAEEVELYVDGKSFGRQNGHKIFCFEVPISGIHVLEAKTAKAEDRIEIRHVEEKDLSYVLEDTGALNWFDAKENDPEYFSINDRYKDLMANPKAAKTVETFLSEAGKARGDMAEEAGKNKNMQEMMKDMQLSSILAFGGKGITAQNIRRLNEELQKIRKETWNTEDSMTHTS